VSAGKLSKVPVDHRVLIHLQAFKSYKDKFEVPFDITQMGIADHILVHRAAAARSLNELREKDLVNSQTKHVIRGNRNRKAYFLTAEGIDAVREVEQNILGSSIGVIGIEKEGTVVMEVRELLKIGKGHLDLIDVCNHLKGAIIRTVDIDNFPSAREAVGGEKLADERPTEIHYFSQEIPVHRNFEGRHDELDRLDELIAESKNACIVIQGIAGIGKTSLAAKAAARCKGSRNVHWVEIHSWTGLQGFIYNLAQEVLRDPMIQQDQGPSTIGNDHGVSASGDFGGLLSRIRDSLKSAPSLLILDDVHNAEMGLRDFLGALIVSMKGIENSTIIMTTRTRVDLYDRRLVAVEHIIEEMDLQGLPFEEAIKLMNRLTSAQRSKERIDRELDGIEPPDHGSHDEQKFELEDFRIIYDRTKGHPFALELISSMGVPSADLDFHRFMREEIFQYLDEEERSILQYCSVLRIPIDVNVFLSVIPESSISLENFESLLGKNILRDRDGRLSIHGIIREFTRDRLSKDQFIHCNRTAVDYYNQIMEKIEEQRSYEDSDPNLVHGWSGNEQKCIIELIHHHIILGSHDLASEMIIEWADALITLGNRDLLEVMERLDITDQDDKRRKELLEIKGDAEAEFGHINKAVESYRERMEQEERGSMDQARMLQKIGEMEGERGDLDASISFKRRSLKILQKRKDHRRSAQLLNELGLDHWKCGQMEETRKCFTEAVELLERSKQRYELSRVLLNLAQLESEVSNNVEADSYLKQSLSYAAKDEEKVEIYFMMGDFSRMGDNQRKALFNYRKAMKLAIKAHDLRSLVGLMEIISTMYLDSGHRDKALEILSEGIRIVEEGAKIHHPLISIMHPPITPRYPPLTSISRGSSISNTGTTETENEAVAVGMKYGLTKTEVNIRDDNYRFAVLCEEAAALSEDIEDWQGSIGFMKIALTIYRNIMDHGRAAKILLRIGSAEFNAAKETEAVRSYRDAYEFFKLTKDEKGCAVSLLNFCAGLERTGDLGHEKLKQVLHLYQKAESISKKVMYQKGIELAQRKIRNIEERLVNL